MIPPASYAQHRSWSVAEFPLGEFAALQSAWSFSQSRLTKISQALAAVQLPREIVTVGIAGSLARMEATAESDCDLVVVLRHDVAPESHPGQKAFAAVWQGVLDVKQTWNGHKFPIDVNVASLPSPSSVVASIAAGFTT